MNVNVTVTIREDSKEFSEFCKDIPEGTDCTKNQTQSVRFIKHDRLFRLRDFDPEEECIGDLQKNCLKIEVLLPPSMKQELAVSISRQTGSGKISKKKVC